MVAGFPAATSSRVNPSRMTKKGKSRAENLMVVMVRAVCGVQDDYSKIKLTRGKPINSSFLKPIYREHDTSSTWPSGRQQKQGIRQLHRSYSLFHNLKQSIRLLTMFVIQVANQLEPLTGSPRRLILVLWTIALSGIDESTFVIHSLHLVLRQLEAL